MDISNQYKIYQDKYKKSAYREFKDENCKIVDIAETWYEDDVINKNYILDCSQYRDLFGRIYDLGIVKIPKC